MIAFEPLQHFTDEELNDLLRKSLYAMRSGPLALRDVRQRQLAAVEKELLRRKEGDTKKK